MPPRLPSSCESGDIDIIGLAYTLAGAVERLVGRVRAFYYEVALSGHHCPACDGHLMMVREGQCRCDSCGRAFDPTAAFQACTTCGGQPRLRIRRYECSRCGADVTSRFLFDGLVFDAAYFREKMVEHRERQREHRKERQEQVLVSRSNDLEPGPVNLDDLPDLVSVLDSLSKGVLPPIPISPSSAFTLQRYEAHVTAHLQPIAITFNDIPPLSENTLKDRIWRFIAILFLAQSGAIRLWQENTTIWLMPHETHRERQAVPGDVEAVDGVA